MPLKLIIACLAMLDYIDIDYNICQSYNKNPFANCDLNFDILRRLHAAG